MANINGDTVGELRENIPLRTGSRRSFNWSCKKECLEGSRLITVSFIGLTIAITISLVIQIHYGDYQIIPHGSVATDNENCSKIGADILKIGGNAVDAAVASTLCLAVVNPHTTGLDAGGTIMIYNHRIRSTPEVIDVTNIPDHDLEDTVLTKLVLGLAYVHLNYGKLHWKELVKPAADLASQGFKIEQSLSKAITQAKVEHLLENYKIGEILKLPLLEYTLRKIGDVSKDKFDEYFSHHNETLKTHARSSTFGNYNIYVPFMSSSAYIFLESLKYIENLNVSKEEYVTADYWRVTLLVEALKEVYDVENSSQPYSKETWSNIAVIDMDDTYVSIVTGMSDFFGAKELSPQGYFLNMKTNEFTNTRLPIILTDRNFVCGRRIVTGTGDLSIATEIVTSLLVGDEDVISTVEAPRFKFIQPGVIGIEDSRPQKFTDKQLEYLNHIVGKTSLEEPYGSCNMIEKTGDDLISHSDSRGNGLAYRFK